MLSRVKIEVGTGYTLYITSDATLGLGDRRKFPTSGVRVEYVLENGFWFFLSLKEAILSQQIYYICRFLGRPKR